MTRICDIDGQTVQLLGAFAPPLEARPDARGDLSGTAPQGGEEHLIEAGSKGGVFA